MVSSPWAASGIAGVMALAAVVPMFS
jgi:hypothetical protein